MVLMDLIVPMHEVLLIPILHVILHVVDLSFVHVVDLSFVSYPIFICLINYLLRPMI